jgi:hypothetical protein
MQIYRESALSQGISMRQYISAAMLFLACLVAGCGGNGEAVAKSTLDTMKEMTAALDSGNKDQVMAVAKKLQALVKEGKEMKVSKSENQRVTDKYKPLIMEETKKMTTAMMKAVTSGKLKQEDLKEISSIMKE